MKMHEILKKIMGETGSRNHADISVGDALGLEVCTLRHRCHVGSHKQKVSDLHLLLVPPTWPAHHCLLDL